MENESKNLNLVKQKVELYHKLGKTIHIVLINSKKWYNGTIKEIGSDFFILKDKKAEVPVFFIEIYKIEPYEAKI